MRCAESRQSEREMMEERQEKGAEMAETTTFKGNIQEFLDHLLTRIAGLQQILVTDRDGVVLLRSPRTMAEGRDQRVDEALTTVFSVSAEQTEKVDVLGRINHLISFYCEGVCLQANLSPLFLTFHADTTVNPGEMVEILPACRRALEPARLLVEEAHASGEVE